MQTILEETPLVETPLISKTKELCQAILDQPVFHLFVSEGAAAVSAGVAFEFIAAGTR